jgi:hypothetical protein
MIIVRQGQELNLINTIRLSEAGLVELECLGAIKNIIRIGAFHGRDDSFYQQRYGAKLWAFGEMDFSHNEHVDYDLSAGKLPIKNAQLFSFHSTSYPEALIILDINDGILVSCDSIKNWLKKDIYFDDASYELMRNSSALGRAHIDPTWLGAMKPSKKELAKISELKFNSLLSAHGDPLLGNARAAVLQSIGRVSSCLIG